MFDTPSDMPFNIPDAKGDPRLLMLADSNEMRFLFTGKVITLAKRNLLACTRVNALFTIDLEEDIWTKKSFPESDLIINVINVQNFIVIEDAWRNQQVEFPFKDDYPNLPAWLLDSDEILISLRTSFSETASVTIEAHPRHDLLVVTFE